MPLLEVNGVRLLVEELGSGEPLVLVHGSWDDRQVWAFIEEDLARRWRAVSYDRRGHTGSEDSAEPGSRRDDEDDLADLIETLGLAPANVVANSFGGSIALGLAARRPALFRWLCAHEPPLLSLAANDPVVTQVGEAVGPVLDLIARGEAEAAARDFVETIALGPGAWEMMPLEERTSMAANADTFAGEQLDSAWADMQVLEAELGRPVGRTGVCPFDEVEELTLEGRASLRVVLDTREGRDHRSEGLPVELAVLDRRAGHRLDQLPFARFERGHPVPEQLPYVRLVPPQERRRRVRGRWRQVRREDAEEVGRKAVRGEVGHSDRAVGSTDPEQLVGHRLLVGREHRPGRRRDDVELRVCER